VTKKEKISEKSPEEKIFGFFVKKMLTEKEKTDRVIEVKRKFA